MTQLNKLWRAGNITYAVASGVPLSVLSLRNYNYLINDDD